MYKLLDNKILLYYEDNMDFCDKHIVATCFESFFFLTIDEVIEEKNLVKVSKPMYIKIYWRKW